MRATLSGYYRNLQFDQSKVAKELFDVTKQISSGQKIQYAHEDNSVFIDAVRLDNEITTLTQVKQNAQSALQVSTNTDTTMNEMTKILEAMKVKLVSAANESHSPESLNAIAAELRGLENNMLQLANTSIDGRYLFSGTEINTKPIDVNGVYQGNDKDMKAFIGSGVDQTYNINGKDLFLGAENDTQRKITANVPHFSLTQLYPDVMVATTTPRELGTEEYITPSNTIRDLMGDTDIDTTNDPQSHFYIRGTRSDGSTFKEKISDISSDQTIDVLLSRIEDAFSPVPGTSTVNVTINEDGQIEIEDKFKGSSKLDFHMVGAIDFDPAGADTANVVAIDNLDTGITDFSVIANEVTGTPPVIPPTNALYVKEFTKSSLTSAPGAASNIEGIIYDRTQFTHNGPKLESNTSQVIKSGVTDSNGDSVSNLFATDATKLEDVFATITSSTLHLEGTQRSGAPYSLDIVFGANPATDVVVVNDLIAATSYNVADGKGTDTVAQDMTYRQLMDIVNMAVNGVTPADNDAGYRAAIDIANTNSSVNLSYDGKITFEDSTSPTSAEISLYDASADDFTLPGVVNGSMATFNSNNTLSISDPKTDFFKQIDEAIKSVELGRIRADGDVEDPRNVGVQNAIQALDDLSDHLYNQHSVAGVQSQTLQVTSDRTEMLIINTQILRSETLDVDIAEASLEMKQLELNYQAMLSTVSRISQLSLVNYL